MDEFSKTEGGIQGRMIAFEFGYDLTTVQAKWKGVGYKKYHETMREQLSGIGIANHGSYNEIGSNTGQIGLFLYLGILYLSLRVLFFSKPRTVREDRVQRLLFIFVISFGISAWVIDWAYRATFFFTAATVASFHRLMIKARQGDVEWAAEENQTLDKPALLQQELSLPEVSAPSHSAEVQEQQLPSPSPFGIKWNRIELLDLVMMFGLLQLCLYVWKLMIEAKF